MLSYPRKLRWPLAVLAILSLGVVGCSDDSSSPTAPPPITPTTTLTAAALGAMTTAIQDEYHAEKIYARVIQDFGDIGPFVNVINAEMRHSASLAALFVSRAMAVPASEWTVNNVPRFASVAEACGAAVGAELANIAIYDDFLALELPADVRLVFENNRIASLQNHLPAFQRCQ